MKSLIPHCDIYTCEHFAGNLSVLISDYSYKEKLLFEPNCLLLSLFRLKDLTLGRDGNLQKHRLSQHAFKMYVHV